MRRDSSSLAWFVIAWCTLAVIFFNAAFYTYTSANPLVSSDGWHFVDTFVGKALDGTVTVGDLFAKRDGVDHSQPLNKLFLLVNARYLGLDFIYEGLLGVAFALLGFLLLKYAADQDWEGLPRGSAYYLPLVALAAVYVSLNSSTIFSWPLVAFGYVTNAFLFVAALLAWRTFLQGTRWYPAAMAASMIVADTAGLLLAIALALAFLLHGARNGRFARAAGLAGLTLAIAAAYLLLYGWLTDVPRGAAPKAGDAFRNVLGIATGDEGWQLLTPLASSVAYQVQLLHYFPSRWEAVQLVLIAVMLGAHLWFWWRSLRDPASAAGFVAVVLMLLVYISYAAVLYGRVSIDGAGYLSQPRYVAFYQLSVVALMLRVLAYGAIPAQAARSVRSVVVLRWRKLVLAIISGLLIVLQVPLSRFSWWEAQFHRQYWHNMASQMTRMADNPAVALEDCMPNLLICQWPEDQRARNLALLQRYRLNVFSPQFRERHRMYVD